MAGQKSHDRGMIEKAESRNLLPRGLPDLPTRGGPDLPTRGGSDRSLNVPMFIETGGGRPKRTRGQPDRLIVGDPKHFLRKSKKPKGGQHNGLYSWVG